MDAIERFLAVTRAYQQLTGLKATTLSWRLFGDSKKLGAIENGADIQVTRYEKALQHLSDTWPDPEPWPDCIARPPKMSDPTDHPVASTVSAPLAEAAP